MKTKQNIPESQIVFNEYYLKLSKKLEESEDTIFSGTSLQQEMDSAYKLFTESDNFLDFLNLDSLSKKNKHIKTFLEDTILSAIYSETKDNLLLESDNNLSFKLGFLLENTTKQFNVQYIGLNTRDLELYEENVIAGLAAGGAAALLGIGILPAGLLGAGTILATSMLQPVRGSFDKVKFSEDFMGTLGSLLIRSKPFFSKSGSSLDQSRLNMMKFDNIDLNPEVKQLFHKLSSKSSPIQDKNKVIDGINTITSQCEEQQDELFGIDPNITRGKYNRGSKSLFKALIDDIFRESSKDQELEDGMLIFRKCLITKLTDMYKFLMIANITTSKDYKKIAKVMTKGMDPAQTENLLSFIHIDTENDELLRENLITLMQLRLMMDTMAKDLSNGLFKADKEAGKFMKQLLKQTDISIEDFMRTHSKQIETLGENKKDFDNKEFKYNKKPDKDFKRNLLGLSSESKSKYNSNDSDSKSRQTDKFNKRY